jgi:hypothetical protein
MMKKVILLAPQSERLVSSFLHMHTTLYPLGFRIFRIKRDTYPVFGQTESQEIIFLLFLPEVQ